MPDFAARLKVFFSDLLMQPRVLPRPPRASTFIGTMIDNTARSTTNKITQRENVIILLVIVLLLLLVRVVSWSRSYLLVCAVYFASGESLGLECCSCLSLKYLRSSFTESTTTCDVYVCLSIGDWTIEIHADLQSLSMMEYIYIHHRSHHTTVVSSLIDFSNIVMKVPGYGERISLK